MNPFSFFHHPSKQREDEPIKHPLVIVDKLQYNITEGGEFLDDAIRMKDQPLMHTEESVAAGNPSILF